MMNYKNSSRWDLNFRRIFPGIRFLVPVKDHHSTYLPSQLRLICSEKEEDGREINEII